ncbi:hypothetical protein NQZ68_035597 [Dissostichus eleginoides]|nr:hypothetical protein NQZ68_035597 [Dissostichus eleginoides]
MLHSTTTVRGLSDPVLSVDVFAGGRRADVGVTALHVCRDATSLNPPTQSASQTLSPLCLLLSSGLSLPVKSSTDQSQGGLHAALCHLAVLTCCHSKHLEHMSIYRRHSWSHPSQLEPRGHLWDQQRLYLDPFSPPPPSLASPLHAWSSISTTADHKTLSSLLILPRLAPPVTHISTD